MNFHEVNQQKPYKWLGKLDIKWKKFDLIMKKEFSVKFAKEIPHIENLFL